MSKVFRFINTILKFFGLKITLSKVVNNRKLSKNSQKNLSIPKLESIALIYLDIGANLDDFILNSIVSFRKFDSETDVFVYTKNIYKKSVYLNANLNIQIREIDGLEESFELSEYFEFGSKEFNYINNLKWTILLSTFALGYGTVIYSDFDIVYLDSPVNYIYKFKINPYWLMIQSESLNRFPPVMCNGFMVFNKTAIPMITDLQRIGRNYKENDQTLLNSYVNDMPEPSKNIYVLPEALFANGLHWKNLIGISDFRDLKVTADSIKPILFHANFLVGLENKKKMLEQLNLWLI